MKSMLRSLVVGTALLVSSLAWAGIDINTADAKMLEKLKGVGPAIAQAIVDYRTQNGPFKSVGDLAKVKGIGPKTLTDITPDATVAAPAK